MRITGTLHGIDTYEKTSDLTRDGEVVGTAVNYHHGILITADDETLRAASNLLCATVDIYPHPVNGLVAGECTPENYAHALARLAHAEDHLAREVRSSQALTMLHTNMCAIADGAMTEAKDLRAEVKRLRRVLHKHGISADTSGEECDGDPLAREVRSSQALAAALEKLQAEHDALAGIAHDLRTKLVTADYIAGKACQALAELSSIYDDAGGEAQAIMCEWDTSGNSAGEHAARRVVDAFT